jgi:hypothetical protein
MLFDTADCADTDLSLEIFIIQGSKLKTETNALRILLNLKHFIIQEHSKNITLRREVY